MPAVRATALLLALMACAAAAPVPKAVKKRTDAEVFVGKWEVESNGETGLHTWTFDDDLTMWSKGTGTVGPGVKWAMKINPEKTPKHIDFGTNYFGLYEIHGDEIRLVYGNQRPADFEQKEKTNYTVLRRAK